jgi:hypothetical protein
VRIFEIFYDIVHKIRFYNYNIKKEGFFITIVKTTNLLAYFYMLGHLHNRSNKSNNKTII